TRLALPATQLSSGDQPPDGHTSAFCTRVRSLLSNPYPPAGRASVAGISAKENPGIPPKADNPAATPAAPIVSLVSLAGRRTVGREKERTELRAGFQSAAEGRGLLLGVSGEPGIGKTALVEDFLAELSAASQPCIVAHGHCSERLAGTEGYLPFLEALEGLL